MMVIWETHACFEMMKLCLQNKELQLLKMIYIQTPLIMATMDTSQNLQQQKKKSSMLQQTLNLKQFDEQMMNKHVKKKFDIT